MNQRLIISLVLVASMLLLLTLQCTFLSVWRPWGVRLELLPALLLYAAFTVNLPTALFLSVAGALMYDTFSAGPFGASIIPYALGTAIFCALRPIFFRNRISTQFISGSVLAFVVLLVQWMLSGKFMMDWGIVFGKIMRLAGISGILAVFYFGLLDPLFRVIGLNPGGFEEGLA